MDNDPYRDYSGYLDNLGNPTKTRGYMEPSEPMPVANKGKPEAYTGSVGGSNLDKGDVDALAEALARRAAEQYVRSIFVSHTRKPLNRIMKQIGKVRYFVWKAYRNGA